MVGSFNCFKLAFSSSVLGAVMTFFSLQVGGQQTVETSQIRGRHDQRRQAEMGRQSGSVASGAALHLGDHGGGIEGATTAALGNSFLDAGDGVVGQQLQDTDKVARAGSSAQVLLQRPAEFAEGR